MKSTTFAIINKTNHLPYLKEALKYYPTSIMVFEEGDTFYNCGATHMILITSHEADFDGFLNNLWSSTKEIIYINCVPLTRRYLIHIHEVEDSSWQNLSLVLKGCLYNYCRNIDKRYQSIYVYNKINDLISTSVVAAEPFITKYTAHFIFEPKGDIKPPMTSIHDHDDWKYNLNTFATVNPDFEINIWSIHKVKELIQREGVHDDWITALDYFNNDSKLWICAIDLARYIILYYCGGIYFDLDIIHFKSFKPLIQYIQNSSTKHNWMLTLKETDFDIPGQLTNAVIGVSGPKNNVLFQIIQQIIRNYFLHITCKDKIDDIKQQQHQHISNVLSLSGPTMFTKCIINNITDKEYYLNHLDQHNYDIFETTIMDNDRDDHKNIKLIILPTYFARNVLISYDEDSMLCDCDTNCFLSVGRCLDLYNKLYLKQLIQENLHKNNNDDDSADIKLNNDNMYILHQFNGSWLL